MARPTKYTKEWAQEHALKLPEMFENGESLVEVAVKLGICKKTFQDLCEQYDFWKDAYNLGKEYSEAWWLRIGREGSAGDIKANGYIWRLNMQNRFGWLERKEEIKEVVSKKELVDTDLMAEIRKKMNE